MKRKNTQWMDHPDFKVYPVKDILRSTWDEVLEFISEPSWDEFSDIMFGMNRLIGSLVSIKYLSIFPDTRSLRKKSNRVADYGHFRSPRHLTTDHIVWFVPNDVPEFRYTSDMIDGIKIGVEEYGSIRYWKAVSQLPPDCAMNTKDWAELRETFPSVR